MASKHEKSPDPTGQHGAQMKPAQILDFSPIGLAKNDSPATKAVGREGAPLSGKGFCQT